MGGSFSDGDKTGNWSQWPQSGQTDTPMHIWDEKSGQEDDHHQLPHDPTSVQEGWDGGPINHADDSFNNVAPGSSMYQEAAMRFRNGSNGGYAHDGVANSYTANVPARQYESVRADYRNEYPYV